MLDGRNPRIKRVLRGFQEGANPSDMDFRSMDDALLGDRIFAQGKD
jgi:hypothetical protein